MSNSDSQKELSFPPKRFAADLWSVFNFADPNERYQKFLQRGRPALKQLLESLILHPETFVPTEDYMSLTVLVGTLGERAVLEMLESGRLKFVRLRGSLAYVGNGGGLQFYQIGSPSDSAPHSAPADEAVAWALGGLNVPVKDPELARRVVDATQELEGSTIAEAIRHETYTDILKSPYLRNQFAVRNVDMTRLAGIEPNQVRIYGGPDTPHVGDEIDTVLMLGMANVELRLAELVGASDIATASPVGHLLKAKVERSSRSDAADAFGELREIAGIPDVGEAVLTGQVEVSKLLELATSKSGLEFQEWFHRHCRTDTLATGREYAALLKEIPKVQSAPLKVLRFLITTGIGLIPGAGGIAGTAAGAFDSFVLERIARGSSPKYFIEHLEQLAKADMRTKR